MGLKDLVAQKAALTEEAIEDIVAEYIRYDTDETEIAFTPEFASLNNKAKILVYLVSLQGWPFVTEDFVDTAVKPAVMVDTLGIPGGTLRPILKALKDGHLITVKNGIYSVRASHLASVKTEITGTGSKATTSKKKTKHKQTVTGADNKTPTKKKKKNSGLGEMINKWIAEGFFDNGKTTSDVRDRFHKETIIVPASSIPVYVNKAVKTDNTLTRDKEEIGGKMVWVYRTAK